MRETLYSPPDGEGPSVVAVLDCDGCKHYAMVARTGRYEHRCYHKVHDVTENRYRVIDPMPTPSWCPIVKADPEGWEKRLKGEGT